MGQVVRVGGAGRELLVQRAIFRTRGSTGEWQTVMQVRDPLPLVHGKGTDANFSAAVEFLRTLRQMSHGGIAVQHYSFDRALHSPWFGDSDSTMHNWHRPGRAPRPQEQMLSTIQHS